MLVDPMSIFRKLQKNAKIRDEIRTNELAYGLVVSEDFKTA